MRILDTHGVIPLCEPADCQAGVDFDSFHIGRFAEGVSILIGFGAITGDSVLSVYCGATAGTKTTKIAFRYQLSSGDLGAASADLFAAETSVAAATDLTLTAATYDHRTLLINLEAQSVDDTKPWITVSVDGTATALFMSAVAVANGPRFVPAVTAIA